MSARRFLLAAAVILLAAAGLWWFDYDRLRPISASGGLYFPVEHTLDVPAFFQNDARWGRDLLGPTDGTLAGEGCAVASAAMVLASYGADLDPGRLNRFVQSIDGYTDRGWLYWEAAAEYPPKIADHIYENLPSYRLIDENLLRGNPVIVRIRLPTGTTHFVVIVGKRGFDYLVRDPGAGGRKGIYPLSQFNTPIEALRFYKKRPAPAPLQPAQATN